MNELDAKVQATARAIFAKMDQGKASIFSEERRQQEMMDWAVRDEALKVELFRFVDVFPVLRSRAEIARHLHEYFDRPGVNAPRLLKLGIDASSSPVVSPIATAVIKREMTGFAQRFIIGREERDTLAGLLDLRKKHTGFTLDVLGESTSSAEGAAAYRRRYLELLDLLAREAPSWPHDPVIDRAAWGPLPRVNVSVKITSLYSGIDPIDFSRSVAAVKEHLRPIFRKGRDTGAIVNVDLEQFRHRDMTYAVFKELLDEDEFRDYEAGIVVQAYLRDAEDDLRGLIDWARRRKRAITVRLVKGAYWDYETVLAAQEGWPVPVFIHKPDSDVSYERLTRLMLEHPEQIHPAFASHNVRSLANAIVVAQALGLPQDFIELQMLHGMGEPIKAAVRKMGLRLREYAPVGDVIPGMGYFVRRLLENTANESFLRLTFADGESIDNLVQAPRPSTVSGAPPERLPHVAPTDPTRPARFRNQPYADFSRAENREAFAAARERVRASAVVAGLGKHWPLWIGDRPLETPERLTSVDPAQPDEVVGTVASAGEREAQMAVSAALRAFPAWRDTAPRDRAAVLFRAADLMRDELFELAALEVFEAGKTWRQADADVCAAIDFLEYYGREMIRLGAPRRLGDAPGEHNGYAYEPRGVAVVVAPFSSPLAGLTGMTGAALVAGNAVVAKPASATPVGGAPPARRPARSTSSPARGARSASSSCATPTST